MMTLVLAVFVVGILPLLIILSLLMAYYPIFKEWLEPDEHAQCLILEFAPFLQQHGWEWSFRNNIHHRTLSYHGRPIFYNYDYYGPIGLSSWYYLKYQIAYRLAKRQHGLYMLRES